MTDDRLGGTRLDPASAEDAPMFDDLEPPDAPGPESPPAPAKKRGGGPRTAEGKEQSKRNSLKHGMRAKVLLPDDLAAAVAERTAELTDEFGPESPYEEWLGGHMAPAATRLDPWAEPAPSGPRGCVYRAVFFWEDDCRKTPRALGGRFPTDPARPSAAPGPGRWGRVGGGWPAGLARGPGGAARVRRGAPRNRRGRLGRAGREAPPGSPPRHRFGRHLAGRTFD